MACGSHVVATTNGGIPELADESCAILVHPRAAVALADALQRLCDQPAVRRPMGITGQEKVVREFSSYYGGEPCKTLLRTTVPYDHLLGLAAGRQLELHVRRIQQERNYDDVRTQEFI